MNQRRFVILLLAALIAISGALFLASQRNLPRDTRGAPLLPGLGAELESVTGITLRKGAATVSLQRSADHWTVAERSGYPADVAKLRKLLLSLGDATVVEEKTSDPAKYALIGVEDVSAAGSTGTEITVIANDGKHPLIVGKPSGDGSFVRRSGEAASYLIKPALSAEAEPRYWIDALLLDVATSAIQKIAVTPPTGPPYAIHRLASGADNFALDAVPPGRSALDPRSVGPSPLAYGGLTADDVAPAAGIGFGPTTATLTLTDGDVITLRGAVSGDKHWLEVKTTKNAALDAKTQGRAFEIAAYRYDAIFRPLEQLLQPKPDKSKPKESNPPKATPLQSKAAGTR
ncbi:MAG: DUF4340 domain-containing protein [Steroidobacteraceae bacterium]|jgi:hypothetical protein